MIAKSRIKRSNQRKPRAQFTSLLLGIIFVLIAGVLVFSNWQMNKRRQELSSSAKALGEEISSLEKRNEELKTGIDSLSQESYLEKEAREKLQLKKPGEKVVTVLPLKETSRPGLVDNPKNLLEIILSKLGL